MKHARLYARLNRWLNTTGLPLPAAFRAQLIARLVDHRMAHCHLPGPDISLDLNLADALQSSIYLDRACERTLSNWLAFFAARSTVIFDIGAYIGYFTLLMHRYAPAGAQLHAFDPDPRAFVQLQQNVKLNQMAVQLNQMAVAGQDGRIQFYFPHVFQLGTARAGRAPAYAIAAAFVRAISLDHYCDSVSLGQIDLVKMNIEGSELSAIAGMKAGLKTGRYGVLFIKLRRDLLTLVQIHTLQEYLTTSGYTLFAVHPDRLSRSDTISTEYLCALSPQMQQALTITENQFLLPTGANLPYK